MTKKLNRTVIEDYCHSHKTSKAEISRQMGFGESYLSNIFLRGGNCPPYALQLLKNVTRLTDEDLIIKEEKPKVEEVLTDNTKQMTAAVYEDIELKTYLKSLSDGQRIIGNLLMQILEELHEIKKGFE